MEELERNLINIILAQQTSIEILANICSGDDDANSWSEADESDMVGANDLIEGHDDDDLFQSDDNASLAAGSAGDESFQMVLPSYLSEVITSHRLTELVLEKANLPAENVCQILKSDKTRAGTNVMRMLNTLRMR